jgi:hypothetical protein
MWHTYGMPVLVMFVIFYQYFIHFEYGSSSGSSNLTDHLTDRLSASPNGIKIDAN